MPVYSFSFAGFADQVAQLQRCHAQSEATILGFLDIDFAAIACCVEHPSMLSEAAEQGIREARQAEKQGPRSMRNQASKGH